MSDLADQSGDRRSVCETRLSVPADQAELAIDRLWSAGAQAIEETDPAEHVAPTSTTPSPPLVEFRTVLADDSVESANALGPIPTGWSARFVQRCDAPAETWRDHVEPVAVSDRLLIVPAWLPNPARRGPDSLTLRIEPGDAFGLGDHPTTRLALGLLDEQPLAGRTVLDVGTGSGVLGILAARRGARSVLGIDVSAAACASAEANAARNGVRARWSTAQIVDIGEQFDIVVCNIVAATLVTIADDLQARTAPGGTLIISGVLDDGYDHVVSALSPLVVTQLRRLEGWAGLVFRHDAASQNGSDVNVWR